MEQLAQCSVAFWSPLVTVFNSSTRWKKHLSINQSRCNYTALANKSQFYQLFILRPHLNMPPCTHLIQGGGLEKEAVARLHVANSLSITPSLSDLFLHSLSTYPHLYDGHASVKDIRKCSRQQQQNTLSSCLFFFPPHTHTFSSIERCPSFTAVCISVPVCIPCMPLYSELEKWKCAIKVFLKTEFADINIPNITSKMAHTVKRKH